MWIRELYYDWTPNFYILFIAPPAISTKSTALSVGRDLLAELGTIHFGPDSLTWQALIKAVGEAREDVLIDGEFHPMSCLTFYSSEMGSLIDLGDAKMMTVLTDLWDGKMGAWVRETRTQGSLSAVNPWINIMAASTPAWLSENMPRRMIGGGFMSRCIVVFSDGKRRLIAYPSREKSLIDHSKIRDELIKGLEDIAAMKGEFKLTDEAYDWGTKWYNEHWTEVMSKIPANDPIAGYLGRKQTHIHKLAMVISASRRDDLTIHAEDLASAEALLTALESDTGRAMRIVQTTESMEAANEMIEYVSKRGRVIKAALYSHYMNRMTYKEFSELLDSAIQAGLLTLRIEGRTEWVEVRKPTGTSS